MNELIITEHTAQEITDLIATTYPEVEGVLAKVRGDVPFLKREIWKEQAAAIYALARQYNQSGANILEIGTAWGYSAAVMSSAAPQANIITLNPKLHEVERAERFLAGYKNVRIVQMRSWDYLSEYFGPELDMIFVDGDHKNVRRDLPWWNWLKVGGLFFHHDYSPDFKGSKRPCQVVYRELNEFKDWLDRDFDVLVMDNHQVGVAGWYKKFEEINKLWNE